MDYLVQLGVDPKRIQFGVAGENEPLHPGYDDMLRKKNARVEIYMLDTLAKDLEGTQTRRPGPHTTEDGPR